MPIKYWILQRIRTKVQQTYSCTIHSLPHLSSPNSSNNRFGFVCVYVCFIEVCRHIPLKEIVNFIGDTETANENKENVRINS